MARLPTGDVTLLFTDIEGSTALLHELGDGYGDVLAEHDRALRAVWAQHGGAVVDTEGDSFFVAFAQARAAVEAAVAAQRLLERHPWPHGARLRVRMGIHTGTPNLRDGDYWGQDVHYAARVGAAAHGGQVLLSATTRALVPDVAVVDHGEHTLKDFPAPRPLHALTVGDAASTPPRTLGAARTNLPTTYGRLIGRGEEVAAVVAALTGDVRLLTLTGVGGTGKSRLAIACGQDLLEAFPDGVFLTRLATVGAAADVPGALAAALGLYVDDGRDPLLAVTTHLRSREVLLVVDNLELVLDAGPVLVDLLEAAPGVRVLATSQAPLRVAPERVMPLDPLGIEAAMALFADRARAADAGFRIAPEDMDTVREICRRLDGLPLGVELAAARVRVGGPARVLAALDRGLDGLGTGARDLPQRQRGLRAALDWTVGLLAPGHRELLATLGVFARPWTLELLEAVVGEEHDAWEGTAALMDHSLVRTRGDGSFAMAETVRAYARELLAASGGEADVRRRHAEAFLGEARRLDELSIVGGDELADAALALAPEFDAAIAWSRAAAPDLHRELVGWVAQPYRTAGLLARLADDLMDPAPEPRPIVAARLHLGRSLVFAASDMAQAMREAERAVALVRPLGDRRTLARFILNLAHSAVFVNPTAGIEHAAEAAALAGDEPALQQRIELARAASLAIAGRIADAEMAVEHLLATAPPGYARTFAYTVAGDCALHEERFEEALRHYGACLASLRVKTSLNGLFQCDGIASSLAGLQRDAEAVEVLAALELAGERDTTIRIADVSDPDHDARFARARERLGPQRAREAQRRGRALDPEALVARALELAAVTTPG